MLIQFYKVFCWDIVLLSPPVEKLNGRPRATEALLSVAKDYEPTFNQWLVPQYSSIFAIAAWLYSSIGVLFLSDSVPELLQPVYDKVYVIYIDVRDISHV